MKLRFPLTIVVEVRQPSLEHVLHAIFEELKRMSIQIDDLKNAVAAEATVIDSAEALLQGLHDALEAAIGSGDIAEVQAVSDSIKAKTAELAAAVEANTPPANP